jgi:hypothetical protein
MMMTMEVKKKGGSLPTGTAGNPAELVPTLEP